MWNTTGRKPVFGSSAPSVADALRAMDLATRAVSSIRVPDILASLTSPSAATELEPSVWESEGGRPAGHADAT